MKETEASEEWDQDDWDSQDGTWERQADVCHEPDSGGWWRVVVVALFGGLGAVAAAGIAVMLLWAVVQWLPGNALHLAEALVVVSLCQGFLTGGIVKIGGRIARLQSAKALFTMGVCAGVVSVAVAYFFSVQGMGVGGQPGAVGVAIDLRIVWAVTLPLAAYIAGLTAYPYR